MVLGSYPFSSVKPKSDVLKNEQNNVVLRVQLSGTQAVPFGFGNGSQQLGASERLPVLCFTSLLALVTSLKQVLFRLCKSLTDVSHDLRHEGSQPELRKGSTAESRAKCCWGGKCKETAYFNLMTVNIK